MRVRDDDPPTVNGIDFLEVDRKARTLNVYFIHDIEGDHATPRNASLKEANVVIEGGVRVRGIQATTVTPSDNTLSVEVDSWGDFSPYTLRIVRSSEDHTPPSGFDPVLSEIVFSFRAECPDDFDCRPADACPPRAEEDPQIDYLAKDYESFRRLISDRLRMVAPDWAERNPADAGVAVAEILAAAGDHLSYFQDAVATEAYLGTARKRTSVRRHARLLDYQMHDGCNARTFVFLEVSNAVNLPKGTKLLTRVGPVSNKDGPLEASSALLSEFRREGAQIFETMQGDDPRAGMRGVSEGSILLWPAHNSIELHTWGESKCCLPKGSTKATLVNPFKGDPARELRLRIGDFLFLEETRGVESEAEEDADPDHRQIVRLTRVSPATDPLFPLKPEDRPLDVVEVEWGQEDALRFSLCVSDSKGNVSVARGNVVLADHGETTSEPEVLKPLIGRRSSALKLSRGPLTHLGHVRTEAERLEPVDPRGTAVAAMRWDMRDVQPAVEMVQIGEEELPWTSQRDLLSSSKFARDFVVETEDGGEAELRFGDDVMGRRPSPETKFLATYRVGNGHVGNVGAGAISHVLLNPRFPDLEQIRKVRNPLPAEGGRDPEPVDLVKLYAPHAFQRQERAVTGSDYARVAMRHPEIQRAEATLRWTGSWYTMFVAVDRKGGGLVDPPFERELVAFLERYRMAGYDVEIEGPRFVPLDIAMTVCVAPGYYRGDVKRVLLEAFSNRQLPDGRPAFFHPDRFTFGQSVYVSDVIGTAMAVPGVKWVDLDETPPKPNRFHRLGQSSRGELAAGRIEVGRLEIARLDNDPNAPENGKIEFIMEGEL